jgi:hypothetical protein
MVSTVVLECGHGLALIDATIDPPETGPWCLWPEPDVEPGDLMSCIIDGSAQRVFSVHEGLLPMTDNGKPVFP